MLFKKEFFSAAEKELIKQAIQQAEKKTSGEIRVYIQPHCNGDVLAYTTSLFHRLKMHETKDRNGVLFFLAYKEHRFAIVGDENIHKRTGDDFWKDITMQMEKLFQQQKMIEGLQKGIEMAGEKLKQYFPYSEEDKNELPDDIIIK